MTVFQRLSRIAKPYRGTLFAGLSLVFVTTFLDTTVITTLFGVLLFLVVSGGQISNLTANPTFIKYPWQKKLWDLPAVQDLVHRFNQLDVHDFRIQLLIILAAITVVAILIKCITDSRQGYLMNKFATLMAREIRQRLFKHLITLSPAQYETEATGARVSRITSDVVVLQQSMGPQLAEVLQAPLSIIFALGLMFFFTWKLTLVALCLAPLIGFVLAAAGRKIRKLSVSIQERLADLNGCLVERLSNVRIIQSFIREPYEVGQVERLNEKYYREAMRSVRLAEVIAPGIELIAYTGMIVGIVLGGIAVFTGQLEAWAFFIFLTQAQKVGTQFKRLSRINQLRQQMNGVGARIFELLDVVPIIKDAPDAQPLPPIQGRIVFDQVGFGYTPGEDVLSNLNIDVAPGEVIALVGPSGAGKTTLVNLLPRFYDPTSGSITVDGMDLRGVTLTSLRAQVGIVPQETVLFHGTIYTNILYGKLDATEEEVIEAARSANALEFIERLPDGFNTVVGERGARLSGGQRQRVAIARALLKNPRILILDEATSALDTESEHLVQQALERLMLDRTTFVIAHRLSTVQHATRILVLESGRIVERGTHQELLAKGGLYQRLYEMQFHVPPTVEATVVEVNTTPV
ncbi:MAG: ABC transporter ATP-binding protein [Armatimonadota bacterium]